ncbi:MAG: 2,3-bisphosphoglycerate-independent phosphoglycerate mutase [Bacteroidia bacterium]|nr:2,3-bisphosphoglycerate-independent phosphoglycerate mutase [Bacteroidia bacterium]
MNSNKVILIIMDGWGIAENPAVSAIDRAQTPFYDWSRKNVPFSRLRASEEWVGLPMGQMGNSEVGHMNIGAGRVVYQDLVKIGKSLREGEIRTNPEYQALVNYCKTHDKPLHLLGLLSDGGVHSHIDHVKDLITHFQAEGLKKVFIHAFMDGRDTDPHGGLGYIQALEAHLKEKGLGKVATVVGRYYAMDRDKRWERIRQAFDMLVNGIGKPFSTAEAAIQDSYAEEVTDEFILPRVIMEGGKPVATIQADDAVLFFNFRTDRGRQLTQALTQSPFHEFNLHPLPLYYVTLTRYDDSFTGVKVMYEKDDLKKTLGEVLEKAGKKQIRIAETEKYPHVTFFFSGGREEPFVGESRLLCPSPKVATYDLQPTMSAMEIRDKIIPELEKGEVDFVCLNFANPDMVGHTGVMEAAVIACETVDQCTEAVVKAALANGYTALVTADHGNCDKMINEDGSPNTAHTTAWVPLLLHEPVPGNQLSEGKLGDLAPTILHLMGIDAPVEMTGEILVQKIKTQA